MLNNVQKLDIFASRIFLKYNMKNSITSVAGGFMSIFCFLFAGLLIFAFGRDFFKRQNPIFIPQTVSLDQYPKYNITNKNFSYAFRLEDTNAIPQTDTTQFYYTFKYRMFVKTNDWETKINVDVPVKKCDSSMFGDPIKYEQKKLDTWFCPEFNYEVGGYWDSDYVAFLQIDVHRCLEGSVNPITKENCAPKIKTDQKLFEKFFYSHFIQSVLINPSNYSSPLSADYSNYYRTLINGSLKREIYLFKLFKVETDYGWIIENKSDQILLGFSDVNFDIIAIDPLTSTKYFETIIYFDKKQDIYFREYPKIQKLIAEVGGFLQVFLTFLLIVAEFYNKYWVNYELANHFINKKELTSFDKFFYENFFKKVKNDNNFGNQNNLELNDINNDIGLNTEKSEKQLVVTSDLVRKSIKNTNIINLNSKVVKKKSKSYSNSKSKSSENKEKYLKEKSKDVTTTKNNEINTKEKILEEYASNMMKYIDSHVEVNNSEKTEEKDLKIQGDTVQKNEEFKNFLKNKINEDSEEVSFFIIKILQNIILEKVGEDEFVKDKEIDEISIDSQFEKVTLSHKLIVEDINIQINSSKDLLKSKENFISFYEYFCTSIPIPCRSNENHKTIYLNALVKTANKYLDTLISVESIMDTSLSVKQLKDLIFNSSQLEIVNHLPHNSFDTFFNNIHKYDKNFLFKLEYDDEIFDAKKFLYSLRKNFIPDKEADKAKIDRVVSNAIKKSSVIDQKIIAAFYN